MSIKDSLIEEDFYDEDDSYFESGDSVEELSFGSFPSSVKKVLSVEDDDIIFGGSSEDEDEEIIVSEEPVEGEKKLPELIVEDGDISDAKSSSTGSDMLSQEEKMRYYADKIISCIVGGKDISSYAIGKLVSSASPKLFRDENYILYSIFYNYRDRIKSIVIDSEFVSLYLDHNRKLIEESSGYIDVHAYGEVDGSETLGYIAGVVKHFNRLCGMPEVSVGEFDLYFEKYLIVFKAIEAQKIYAQSNQILTEGLRVGRKLLVGFEDSFNYSRRKLAELEGLADMNQGTGFISMNEILRAEKGEGKKSEKIADFDTLDALNEHYGGVYTGNFYQVLAPAKAGKSKFCARLCHTAIVKYGNNVTVWAQEGGPEAWTAQMRAIHFDYTYNEGVGIQDRKFGVSQDVILHDKFPTDELRDLELASKLDLDSNTDYGVVDYIDRPFVVETFLDDIDSSVKTNNSKLLIIDYLQLIGSLGNKSDRECIATAYKRLLDYCKKNNIAVITPAQYKQDSIDALATKGKDSTEDAEMRTAGGGSAEVLRTPDITFAFWASTADLRNNSMKILSMPCRFNKPFPEINCYIDLSVCKFVSLND